MNKLIVLGIVIISLWLMIQYPYVMLNPGELTAGHQEIKDKCLSCHKPFWGIPNDKCMTCHKLADIGRDTLGLKDSSGTRKNILFHQQLRGQKCVSCHTDHQGLHPDETISSFAHELLSEAVISKCSSCHQQPADNLHKQVTPECKNCHQTKSWKSGTVFNHDWIRSADKNNCGSCHLKPDDSYHRLLKENCDKCHLTDKWVPSTFDHSNYFQLDKEHNVSCNTCHVNNILNAFTCYGCHEHSPDRIRRKHEEEGIYNFASCTSCHKSSNEHDIRMDGNTGREFNQQEKNKVKEPIKSGIRNNDAEHGDGEKNERDVD